MALQHDSGELIYTWHACERMRTLLIEQSEVEATVHDPEQTWPGRMTRQGPTRHFAGRSILVLLSGDGRTVITVKLRTPEPYVHGLHHRYFLPGVRLAA